MIRLLINLLCYITGLTIGMLITHASVLFWFLTIPTLSVFLYLDQRDKLFWKKIEKIEKDLNEENI